MQKISPNNNNSNSIKYTKCKCKDVMIIGNLLKKDVRKFCLKLTVITAQDVLSLLNSKLILLN